MIAGGVANWETAVVVAMYTAITLTYSAIWKHIAVIDLIAIASGFVLRAAAGAVAVDVPMSSWFVLVTTFGSLFIVAGKRFVGRLGGGFFGSCFGNRGHRLLRRKHGTNRHRLRQVLDTLVSPIDVVFAGLRLHSRRQCARRIGLSPSERLRQRCGRLLACTQLALQDGPEVGILGVCVLSHAREDVGDAAALRSGTQRHRLITAPSCG